MVDNTNPVAGGTFAVSPPEAKGRNAATIFVAAALIGLAGLGMYSWKSRETGETAKERSESTRQQQEKVGDLGQQFRKPRPDEMPVPAMRNAATDAFVNKPGQGAGVSAAPVRRRPMPGGDGMLSAAPKPVPAATETAAKPVSEGDGRPVKLAGMPVMRAERIDDPSWYLFPGDTIMCRNDAQLTEKTGAFWTATIPEAKLSRDGSRELIPANSQAFGKIVTGFNHGDRRLAAVITHIAGPSVAGKPMLLIPIEMGQVGDDLGRVDMDGNIESNFRQRLGTVGLYAALDAVARGGTSFAGGQINRALNGGDGPNINIGNFGGMGTGNSLAGTAFREELSKQPGFTRPQAQPCSIMITQPIDFKKSLQIGGK